MRFCFLVLLLMGVGAHGDEKVPGFESGLKIYQNQCASCHGEDGESRNVPLLQGQERRYLESQLGRFRAGSRKDGTMDGEMNSVAEGLSDDQIRDVALYLSVSDPCEIASGIDPREEGFKEKFIAGRELYSKNNCMHCHASFHHEAPRIMGQRKGVVRHAFGDFLSGTRKAPHMKEMLEKMNEDQLDQLAVYMSGMRLMRSCPENTENR